MFGVVSRALDAHLKSGQELDGTTKATFEALKSGLHNSSLVHLNINREARGSKAPTINQIKQIGWYRCSPNGEGITGRSLHGLGPERPVVQGAEKKRQSRHSQSMSKASGQHAHTHAYTRAHTRAHADQSEQ